MPNHLIDETSPYLLQHAHNPVDWYPWGPSALERAINEDMPILLSVGYSACHWCHVMERESFENSQIADLMNENFVCIKVDREERPDIDSIYMTAVQALSGQGGWPMTVFLTPDGKPYYGGTYFPPEDRHGMPGFPKVIKAMADAYRDNQEDVTRATSQLIQRMEQVITVSSNEDAPSLDILDQACLGLVSQFDKKNGGIGGQPKFPQPMIYEFLLRQYVRTNDKQALAIVETTLDRMAAGGIYDQIGGGFHRYSTDSEWLVPHFEKMLYDNALLASLYLHAYQVTGNDLYRNVVEETLDYVSREMLDKSGGFYSAQDADSEGVEGKFFVWENDEITNVLGKEDAEIIKRFYGVTRPGNFEGSNILHVSAQACEVALSKGMDLHDFLSVLKQAKQKLLEFRDTKVHPGLDDKILTSWNALMMRAFAEASEILGRKDYRDIAKQNANFLLNNLRPQNRLLRTYKDGKAKLNGYLEDYAYLVDALIVLHEVTADPLWITQAISLGQEMLELFWDQDKCALYDTGKDHENLVIRPRDISDNAVPSGNSMASFGLLRLAIITGDKTYEQVASAILKSVSELAARVPAGSGNWLCALDFFLSPVKEIAIVGDIEQPETQALHSEVFRNYLPNRVVLCGMSATIAELPLMLGRGQIDNTPTAYVCYKYVCKLPVTDPMGLAEQLYH